MSYLLLVHAGMTNLFLKPEVASRPGISVPHTLVALTVTVTLTVTNLRALHPSCSTQIMKNNINMIKHMINLTLQSKDSRYPKAGMR